MLFHETLGKVTAVGEACFSVPIPQESEREWDRREWDESSVRCRGGGTSHRAAKESENGRVSRLLLHFIFSLPELKHDVSFSRFLNFPSHHVPPVT